MSSPPAQSRKRLRVQRSITEVVSHDHAALKASGLYQTTSVQDRIKQWQSHGAASALPPDAISLLSPSPSEAAFDLDSPSEKAIGHNELQQKENRKPPGNECATDKRTRTTSHLRSASTPRKRVVSDEHWKAKRNTPKEVRIEARDSGGEATVVPGSVVSTPQTQGSIRTSKEEREERRRRRVEARISRTQQNAIKNHSDSRPLTHGETVVSPTVDKERLEHGGYVDPNEDIKTEVSFRLTSEPSESGSVVEPNSPPQEPRSKSRYAETLGRSPVPSSDGRIKSRKGSFLTKTREVLGIATPPLVVSNRLPSIEAWLYDQPDPFVESLQSGATSNSKSLSLPKTHLPKRQVSKPQQSPLDPNKIWEAIENRVDSGKHIVLQEEGTNLLDGVQAGSSKSSPISLTRRGARVKRPKAVDNFSSVQPERVPQDESPEATEGPYHGSGHRMDGARQGDALSKDFHVVLPNIDQQPAQGFKSPQEMDTMEFKGRYTTHEDMLTVLSRPSLRKSARKKRHTAITTHQQNKDQIQKILQQFAKDEAQYSRELRTLVDGVIPVLLQCVLSKTDAVAAANLFTSSSKTIDDLSFGRPVIEMGIALERLKSLHNRIPLDNVDSFFTWCQSAHKAYKQYLKAWKLGFQDIVVNLSPLEDSEIENNEVMERDSNGDIVNSNGQTVDIAYLMKRPLVNIRKLGRVLSTIHEELPDHSIAEKTAEDFRDLTAAAKAKHQQEKARVEDEAAAKVDATKCRDLRNLAPLAGVMIDRMKRVRARDCFTMTLFHSTGQRMDCQIEIILRDNHQNTPDGGDLLICQVEESGKWLLFAPVSLNKVSARKGELGCDLVIMIRGKAGIGQEWHELLALQVDEAEAISEWMIMLGSNPLPPKLTQVPSFEDPEAHEQVQKEAESIHLAEDALQRVPSIGTIEFPIGEPSKLGTIVSKSEGKRPVLQSTPAVKPLSQLNMGGGLRKKHIPQLFEAQNLAVLRDHSALSVDESDRSTISRGSRLSASSFSPSSLAPMNEEIHSGKRYTKSEKAVEHQRYEPQVMRATEKILSKPEKFFEFQKGVETAQHTTSGASLHKRECSSERPAAAQSLVLKPTIPAPATSVRAKSETFAPARSESPVPRGRAASVSSKPLTEAIRDTWSSISGFGRKAVSHPSSPAKPKKPEAEYHVSEEKTAPRNGAGKMQAQGTDLGRSRTDQPLPPQHNVANAVRQRPILRPSEAQIKMDRQNGRLSHSPLRHEYTPSSASTSDAGDSDASSCDDSGSQTSMEDQYEQHYSVIRKQASVSGPASQTTPRFAPSVSTTGARTVAPSDSASQGHPRRLPSSSERPEARKLYATAMVCSWNDNGSWEPIVEGYCSIVVSPGLMEAFAANSTRNEQKPLVAFELTPLVPLRRGTGLDINIRSPPMADSQIRTSSNIMFRSRNPGECYNLYHIINWSRCCNEKYIEMQRSRPPPPQPAITFNTFNTEDPPRPRSWFSFGGIKRRSSYRVGNIPPSTMGESQTTANTTFSAMSALKRLTQSSSFNLNRSSVKRREGGGTGGSLYSSSQGTGVDSLNSTPPPSQLGMIPVSDGSNLPLTNNVALNGGGMVHNMKIRLQVRESQGWNTIGLSRLSVLPAVKNSDGSPVTSRPSSSHSNAEASEGQSRRFSTPVGYEGVPGGLPRLDSANHTPHRLHGHGNEKRVVVTWEKDPSRILLDATLGETCFEKINHLGIAVQVWTPYDEVRSRGGVLIGQNTKYLFQFFTANECAWVFELVGRYRYGKYAD